MGVCPNCSAALLQSIELRHPGGQPRRLEGQCHSILDRHEATLQALVKEHAAQGPVDGQPHDEHFIDAMCEAVNLC